jgi:hypothetical protein
LGSLQRTQKSDQRKAEPDDHEKPRKKVRIELSQEEDEEEEDDKDNDDEDKQQLNLDFSNEQEDFLPPTMTSSTLEASSSANENELLQDSTAMIVVDDSTYNQQQLKAVVDSLPPKVSLLRRMEEETPQLAWQNRLEKEGITVDKSKIDYYFSNLRYFKKESSYKQINDEFLGQYLYLCKTEMNFKWEMEIKRSHLIQEYLSLRLLQNAQSRTNQQRNSLLNDIFKSIQKIRK